MPEIRVAMAGVGNCASALVQGVEYYKNVKEEAKVPGLMHVNSVTHKNKPKKSLT